ncbi:guanine-N(1)--methyltransferase [Sarocladium strictum]
MSALFRAPAARGIKKLDTSLFSKVLPTTAASVRDNKLLSSYRKSLEKHNELLRLRTVSPIVDDTNPAASKGQKCLILAAELKRSAPETWSPVLQEAVRVGDLTLAPYDLHLDYSHWSYVDIMKSILPEELADEIPTGFNSAGHVAHLNLRDRYLPYKYVIAEVIVDKNPTIKTVINKVDNVGGESEFRTFAYEVLAGPDDLAVEVNEANCTFKFDYSKTYWNTKLSTEHARLVSLFEPGQVVADVMAGIGPFAVPAGKKGVFVWANDKNPESYGYLQDAMKRNKTGNFVRPFNEDGHDFIRFAADDVLRASKASEHAHLPAPRHSRKSLEPPPKPVRVDIPPTISHFVMNLPASALEFLHNFRGIYEGQEALFAPHTETRLPIVHPHCFAIKGDDEAAFKEICDRIEAEIGVRLKPGKMDVEGEVEITEVRDVAPAKRMFCASFRVPAEVAFASRK